MSDDASEPVKAKPPYTRVRDAFNLDPKWVYEDAARRLENSQLLYSGSTDGLYKYLLLANSGGLLVAFTFSGVLVQTGQSMLGVLLSAIPFATGLFLTGLALFNLRRSRRNYYDYHHKMLQALIFGITYEVPKEFWQKLDEHSSRHENILVTSFILFLVGAFFGFVVLAIPQLNS